MKKVDILEASGLSEEDFQFLNLQKLEFMRPIQRAMVLLNKHPLTISSGGKEQPILKRLVLDDVKLPQGTSRLMVSIGPAKDLRNHKGEPETKIIMENVGPVIDDPVFPAFGLRQYGDGEIDMILGSSLESLDEEHLMGPSRYSWLGDLDINDHSEGDFSMLRIHRLSFVIDAAIEQIPAQ